MPLYPAKLNPSHRDPILDLIASGNDQPRDGLPREIEPGVYQFGHWNPEHFFDVEIRDHMWSFLPTDHPKYVPPLPGGYPGEDFGVCDGWEQLDRKFPILRSGPVPIVVCLVEMRREDQDEGGWRWHKWGEYVGEQDPKCEYLRDEPVIESAWTFHLYSPVGVR